MSLPIPCFTSTLEYVDKVWVRGGGIQGHEAVLWDLLKKPSVFVSAWDGGGGGEI